MLDVIKDMYTVIIPGWIGHALLLLASTEFVKFLHTMQLILQRAQLWHVLHMSHKFRPENVYIHRFREISQRDRWPADCGSVIPT